MRLGDGIEAEVVEFVRRRVCPPADCNQAVE
jgi:hypothetical protein